MLTLTLKLEPSIQSEQETSGVIIDSVDAIGDTLLPTNQGKFFFTIRTNKGSGVRAEKAVILPKDFFQHQLYGFLCLCEKSIRRHLKVFSAKVPSFFSPISCFELSLW